MKYYRIEPTYKKSVVEFDIFKRHDEDGNLIFLRKELGWRWGSFLVSVPETEEEALEYIKELGYEDDTAAIDWAMDYGHTVTEGDDEVIPSDTSLVELVQGQLLPNETDDFVDITEDYDMEMLYCDDGCWEDWSVTSYVTEIDDEQQELWIEEAESAWDEDYQEGVEELGWEFVDNMFEMQCSPQIIPCDEHGHDLKGEEENAA